MPSLSKDTSYLRRKLMLLGPSGVGKTRQLGLLANAGYKVRICDVDNNLAILRSTVDTAAQDNVTYCPLPAKDPASWDKLERVTKHWKTDDEDLGLVESWGPDCILAIDSGTFASDLCLSNVLAKKGIAADATGFDQSLWNVYAKKFELWLARLTSNKLNCHLIITAHLKFSEDERGVNRAVPFFQGRYVPTVAPSYFNNNWALETKPDGKVHLLTRSTSIYVNLRSSDPLNVKPDEIDPDIGKIFRAMESLK